MVREIALDTETTGFEPSQGHRLVEIGCVELVNHLPTGRTFHVYINPDREVPEEAFSVHGLSYEFLKNHPPFLEVVPPFLDFIEDSPLIIHNAKFDMKFLNAELTVHSKPEIPFQRALDTLSMARKKFPGSPASLDALCKRFGIDNTARDKHGALIDAELLAKVYLELIGGKQPELSFDASEIVREGAQNRQEKGKKYYPPRPHSPTPEEADLHRKMLAKINIKI